MPRLMPLVLIVVLWMTRSAEAQRVITAGDTVQLQVAQRGPVVRGVVRQATAGQLLMIDRAGAERQFAPGEITSLRLLQGRRSASGRGALIGLAIGGTIGMAGGIAATADQSGLITFGPEVIPVAAAFFGGGGALVGAIIGSFIKRDHWVQAQLPPNGPAGVAESRPRITPVVMSGAESTWRIGVRLR